MPWGLVGLSLHPSPAQANVQLPLPGYCCRVEDSRLVQELLAPPVAPRAAGPAEQTWAEEVPLPLGGFSSRWAPWELERADLGSVLLRPWNCTVQSHICVMLLKHRLPVMKYSCPSPKGLRRGKSMCPSRAPLHARRRSVLQRERPWALL